MSISATGHARIRHAETGEIYTIEPDELDWQQIAADERQMGVEVAHSATIDHPQLGLLTWTLWEYPLGMENDREVDVGPHSVLESFRLSLDGDAADEAADREGRVEAMVEWFLERYEDPANQTPHDSSEGGYIYVWGGPYDAREQIGDNFSDEDESLIEAAVARVERDGTVNWAPVPGTEGYNDGERDEPDDGDAPAPTEVEVLDSGFVDSPELFEILRSVPSADDGPIFARDDQNHIELANWTPSPAPDPSLLQALRDHAADLLVKLDGTNAHQDLLAAVRHYADAIGETPVSIPRLYVEGVHLENVSTRVETEILTGDRSPLPGSSSASLDSVRELHGVLIALTPEGLARLDASARYRRGIEAQETLTRSANQLAEAVRDATDLFGPMARDLVDRVAAETGRGPRAERSNQTSVGLLTTVLISAVTAAGVAGLTTIVGDGLAATPLGSAMQHGVTTLATAAGGFILNHVDALRTFAATVGPELTWLRQLSDWILARRQSGPDKS